jgi:hypothetical protein
VRTSPIEGFEASEEGLEKSLQLGCVAECDEEERKGIDRRGLSAQWAQPSSETIEVSIDVPGACCLGLPRIGLWHIWILQSEVGSMLT